MANKIVNLRKLSNSGDIQLTKVTKSTEIYTDISLDSKYMCFGTNSVSTDNLREERYINNLIVTEISADTIPLITDASQIKVDDNNDRSGFKVSKSINVNAVENSIENIFSFIPGERVLQPEFGSKIRNYLYEGINVYNVEQIVAEINSAFLKFDPRVAVDNIRDVSDINDTDDNTVVLRITYHIRGLPMQYYSYDYSYVRPLQ